MHRRQLAAKTQARLQHIADHLLSLPPAAVPSGATRLAASLDIALVSPVYGGGDQPGEREPGRLFRTPSIRGQLRFWWRAARAAAFGLVDLPRQQQLKALQHLRLVEGCIWGITSATHGAEDDSASAIASCLRVRAQATGASVREQVVSSDAVPLQSGRGYVYFPARPTSREGVARAYWWGPGMRLTIEADLQRAVARLQAALGGAQEWTTARVRQELAAALWAWSTFGGYGARTRRGAGALAVTEVEGDDALRQQLARRPRDPADLVDAIIEATQQFVAKPAADTSDLPECPLLHGGNIAVVPIPEKANATLSPEERAVEAAGELVRRFRQDRVRAQGRSRWPEPNALRRFLGRSDPRHVPPADAPLFFPRAALGLPIVFHFKSENDPSCELVGQHADRLASPLIVRPHRLANGKLALVVLVLNTPWEPPGGLAVRYGKTTTPLPAEAGPLDGGPLAPAVAPLRERRADNALSAFLRYVGGMEGAVVKRIGS